jgi:hypothetical protein
MKATWSVVLGNHHSSMEQTTPIERFACRHIFRGLICKFGRSVRTLLTLCLYLVLVPLRSRGIGTTQIAGLVVFLSQVFRFLSLRVSNCATAREIWVRLWSCHKGTTQVKTRLFETYKCEYENFSQLEEESIDAMFSCFQTIVNKMWANKP